MEEKEAFLRLCTFAEYLSRFGVSNVRNQRICNAFATGVQSGWNLNQTVRDPTG